MLLRLKLRVIETHGNQFRAALALGINPGKFSQIINELAAPNAVEREKLVAAFGPSVLAKPRVKKVDGDAHD